MGRRGATPFARFVGAVAAPAVFSACDNLSPEVSGIADNDEGAGPIGVGHHASLTGSLDIASGFAGPFSIGHAGFLVIGGRVADPRRIAGGQETGRRGLALGRIRHSFSRP